MKTKILALLCALFVTPAIASANEYGEPGTIEVGGELTAGTQTTKVKNGGKQDATLVQLSPEVGYYVSEGLVLLGQLPIQSISGKDETGTKVTLTGIGIGAGAGYFIKAGTAHIGPSVLAQYQSQNIKFGDIKLDDTRPGATVRLTANLPVGHGGLISAGVHFDYASVDQKVTATGLSVKDKGTATAFGTTVGFLVWF
jgi:hypothetical protein